MSGGFWVASLPLILPNLIACVFQGWRFLARITVTCYTTCSLKKHLNGEIVKSNRPKVNSQSTLNQALKSNKLCVLCLHIYMSYTLNFPFLKKRTKPSVYTKAFCIFIS